MPAPKITPSQVVGYIERAFPEIAEPGTYTKVALNHPKVYALAAVGDMCDAIPSELLVLSDDDYAEYLTAVTALRFEIQNWLGASERRGSHLVFLEGQGQTTSVDVIVRVLRACPDLVPAAEPDTFSFIDEADLRIDLLSDYGSASRAFSTGDWKAATVMAGSLVEALLLWRLARLEPKQRREAVQALQMGVDPELLEGPGWGIWQYAEVASHLKLIEEHTFSEVRQLKDFRNLIHPGRSIRLGRKCDRGSAYVGLAAIEFVRADCSKGL